MRLMCSLLTALLNTPWRRKWKAKFIIKWKKRCSLIALSSQSFDKISIYRTIEAKMWMKWNQAFSQKSINGIIIEIQIEFTPFVRVILSNGNGMSFREMDKYEVLISYAQQWNHGKDAWKSLLLSASYI